MNEECITREDAMWAACKALCHPGVRCPDNCCIEVRKVFNAIPTADVVEVVRCGECEYWDTTWNPRAAKNGEQYCPATDLYTTPDWFCADGERREVQDDG